MISFIVPTTGRATLQRTLDSIECWPGDEVLIVGQPRDVDVRGKAAQLVPMPPGGDWGNAERNVAMALAQTPYLAFIDDDDWYAPGARAAMADAIRTTPGRLVIFSMQFPDGLILWAEPALRCGNVGTPMLLVPNDPARLGRWPTGRYEGDWGFLDSCRYPREDIVWREEIVAQVGRNIGQAS
jgi:hypothetical protein